MGSVGPNGPESQDETLAPPLPSQKRTVHTRVETGAVPGTLLGAPGLPHLLSAVVDVIDRLVVVVIDLHDVPLLSSVRPSRTSQESQLKCGQKKQIKLVSSHASPPSN